MKQVIRIQTLLIPNKLRVDVRVSFDEKTEYRNPNDGALSAKLYPWMMLSIIRPYDPDNKSVWNPNDSLGLTAYTMPIFLENLTAIQNDLKTPDLYKYTDNRLELNDKEASKIRKVFMVGNTTVEFSAVIIEQSDVKVEGIKIKFNNENSTVGLTLNDLESLRYNMKNISMAQIALNAYFNFYKKNTVVPVALPNINPTMVDIEPLPS